MSRPLRYVVVGVGGWGGYWCREVLPRLRALELAVPVAAVDRDGEALAAAAPLLGLAPAACATEPEDVFGRVDADFVVIVVPPAHHEAYVDLAIANGMDVLCEKPMADDLAGCVRVMQKVQAAATKFAVTMSHRFDADKQTLSALVRSGDYGPLNYVVARFATNARTYPSWGDFRHRMADPLVIEGAVHHFDILREVAGADANVVSGLSWNPPWGEYAGDTVGLFTFAMTNGVRCTYEGSIVNASHLNWWANEYVRAECELATIELDRRRVRVIPAGDAASAGVDVPLLQQPAWTNPWLAELFCRWVAGSGPPPPTVVEDNIQCMAMTFGAVEAARTGGPVDVQALLGRAVTRS